MPLYIACYDIRSDRIRTKVAKVLSRYGQRLQRSVFEVWLDPEDLPEFRRSLGSLMAKTDAFDLIAVDERPNRTRLRWQKPLADRSPVVLLE